MTAADNLYQQLSVEEREQLQDHFADYHRRDTTIRAASQRGQEAAAGLQEAYTQLRETLKQLPAAIEKLQGARGNLEAVIANTSATTAAITSTEKYLLTTTLLLTPGDSPEN